MLRSEDEYVDEILKLERPLRAFLHRYAPQPTDLDDLLQETYAHLFRLSPQRRLAVQNIRAFVLASARNVATDYIRHRQVVSIESLDDPNAVPHIEDASQLEEIVHVHQQLSRLADEIARMPERCRRAFTLRRIYGMSQKEIARKLNISEGAVEQLLIRAMRHCAQFMQTDPQQASLPGNKPRRWLGRLRQTFGVDA